MDIPRSQDDAALIRAVKGDSTFALTASQVQKLEGLAQIYDRAAARNADDDDVQFQTEMAAWERDFASTLARGGSFLLSDATSRQAYIARLTAPAPPPPSSTDLFDELWPSTVGTPASVLEWVIDGTGGGIVQQGDGTAIISTTAVGGGTDYTRFKAIHTAKDGLELDIPVTFDAADDDLQLAFYFGDNTWSSVDGELPTNGPGMVLIPAEGVVKSRYVVDSVKSVEETPYAYDGAHLTVNIKFRFLNGLVEIRAWNDGSAMPAAPIIPAFTDPRVSGPLVLQGILSGGQAATAKHVRFGAVAVKELQAISVAPGGSANLRAAIGVYVANYEQPFLAAWETAHGAPPKYATAFLGQGPDFEGSAAGTFAPTDYLTTETWHGSSVPWTATNISDKVVQVAVPLAFTGTGGATLAQVAAGAADSRYQFAAARMALANPAGTQIIVRLGWEPTGNWYPWAINFTGTGAAATKAERVAFYNAAFRRVHDIFVAAMPGVRFCWCLNNGLVTQDIDAVGTGGVAFYPGDGYVDFVAMDTYNTGYGIGPTEAQRDAVWDAFMAPDFYTLGTFAKAHTKKVALPEWATSTGGPNSGGGDDPVFVERVNRFLTDGVVVRTGRIDRFGVTLPAGEGLVIAGWGPDDLGYDCWFDTGLSDGTDFRLITFPAARSAFDAALV